MAGFNCGAPPLNEFLERHALANHQAGTARTFVATSDRHIVVGYYRLSAAQLLPAEATPRLQKGAPRHPVPIVLLARLAVAKNCQGQGLGAGLLRDAILRTLSAAKEIGVRALLVHAKDDAAKEFYQHYGFESLPGHPLHLTLLLKDARNQLTS
ncbi:MAG TPA: GNAT family N-acetyltransferase [Opitutaceae bacterium]